MRSERKYDVPFYPKLKDPQERPTAIIVTFPVAFLLDLANTLIQRGFYQHPWNHKKAQFNERYFNLRQYQHTKDLPRQIKNTRKEKILMGFKECIWQIETVGKDPEGYWWHSMGNKPVNASDIKYVYVNILGKIRYRFTCAGFEQGGEKQFPDNRKLTAKNWLLLTAPEKISDIKMGGFQGFRYWKEDYYS